MAYWLKTKRTRKHATLNSLTETAILSLVAKLGLKCHSLQMKKPKIYKNIRKINIPQLNKKHLELYTKTINLIKNLDDRATLQVLNTKLRISQNSPICGAEEKQPSLKKQHRLNPE